MWHTWGGYGSGIGMVGMALLWVVVIVAIVIAVRAFGGRYAGPPSGPSAAPPHETPLEILQRRYARGEIDKREFDEKKKDLS